jgi:hypothetical protein
MRLYDPSREVVSFICLVFSTSACVVYDFLMMNPETFALHVMFEEFPYLIPNFNYYLLFGESQRKPSP